MSLFGFGEIAAAGINAISQAEVNKANMYWDQEKYWSEVKRDQRNYDFQREQFDYQKQLNDLTMQREDNAISRRVADMRASGLSPVLAAGSAADSSSFSAGSYGVSNWTHASPEMKAPDFSVLANADPIGGLLSFMTGVQNIDNLKAQQALTEAEANFTAGAKTNQAIASAADLYQRVKQSEILTPWQEKHLKAQIGNLAYDNILKSSQATNLNIKSAFEKMQYDYKSSNFQKYGMPDFDDMGHLGKVVFGASNYLNHQLNSLGRGVGSAADFVSDSVSDFVNFMKFNKDKFLNKTRNTFKYQLFQDRR